MLAQIIYPFLVFSLFFNKNNKAKKYDKYTETLSELIGKDKTTSYQYIEISCEKSFKNAKPDKIKIDLIFPKIISIKDSKAKKQINRFILEHYKINKHKAIYKAPEILLSEYKQFIQSKDNQNKEWRFNFRENIMFNSSVSLGLAYTATGFTGEDMKFQQIRFYNLSPKTGNLIDLNGLFYPNSNKELVAIAEKIFRQNYKLSPNTSLLSAGFLFPKNVFKLSKNYLLSQKGILFYYNEGEINSIEKGSSVIEIPFSDIENLVKVDWRERKGRLNAEEISKTPKKKPFIISCDFL